MPSESDSSNLRKILTVCVCLLVIGGAAFFIVRMMKPRQETIPNAYFFDLNTKKIFVDTASKFAPFTTPSGPFENEPAGVRVFLFSCSPCPNFNGKTLEEAQALGATVGWFERFNPEAKAKLEAGDRNPEVLMEGIQMRTPTGTRWQLPSTRESLTIRDAVARLCAGLPGKVCTPE